MKPSVGTQCHTSTACLSRILIIAVIVLAFVVGLAGCRGPDGAVFIAFTHDSNLYGFLYDDPNLPNIASSYTIYETAPGSYYAEWTYDDSNPPYYYTYYDITADEGGLFWAAGEDTFFELYMGRGTYDFFTFSNNDAEPIQGARLSADNRLPIDPNSATLIHQYTKESGSYTLSVSVYEQGDGH
jgi:hypothetical protein